MTNKTHMVLNPRLIELVGNIWKSDGRAMTEFKELLSETKDQIRETADRDALTVVVNSLAERIKALTETRDSYTAAINELTGELVGLAVLSASSVEIPTETNREKEDPEFLPLYELGLSMHTWRRLAVHDMGNLAYVLRFSESAFLSLLTDTSFKEEALLLIQRIKKEGYQFPQESVFAKENLTRRFRPYEDFDLRLFNRLSSIGVYDGATLLEFYQKEDYPQGIAKKSLLDIRTWLIQKRLLVKV